ncbi:PLD nuclease N-terminal domain-containing protein [Microbacterium sp.]|uniref:PLD nuclease N-terminal domain-containing protein n=1 Tax=Microbacterium sp. TaxID=51671 RepID=UPI0039E36151
MAFLFSLLVIALMIGALIDIITRDDSAVRFLPKMAWIIIVILLPFIGSVLWFGIGREYFGDGVRMPRPQRREHAQHPPPPPAPSRPVDTRTTEQQIEDLDREIEEWRLRAEIEKRKQNPSAE